MLSHIRLALFCLVGLGVAAALAVSLLPFIETKWWLIRLLGFPRLPFGIATLGLLALLLAFGRSYPRSSRALAAWPLWP